MQLLEAMIFPPAQSRMDSSQEIREAADRAIRAPARRQEQYRSVFSRPAELGENRPLQHAVNHHQIVVGPMGQLESRLSLACNVHGKPTLGQPLTQIRCGFALVVNQKDSHCPSSTCAPKACSLRL